MARPTKQFEVNKAVYEKQVFIFCIDEQYYKYNVACMAQTREKAETLVKAKYPEAVAIEFVIKAVRCIIDVID